MAAYTGQLQVLVPGGFGDCQVDFFKGYSGFQRRRPKIQECFSSQLTVRDDETVHMDMNMLSGVPLKI